jgi:hypothetical protein
MTKRSILKEDHNPNSLPVNLYVLKHIGSKCIKLKKDILKEKKTLKIPLSMSEQFFL